MIIAGPSQSVVIIAFDRVSEVKRTQQILVLFISILLVSSLIIYIQVQTRTTQSIHLEFLCR
jgi:hypothetical protein